MTNVEVTQPPPVVVEVTEGPIPTAGGGGGMPPLPWILGGWYSARHGSVTHNPANGPQDKRIYAAPIYVPLDCAIDAAGIRTVQAMTGQTLRWGIYTDGGGKPGSLVYGSDPAEDASGVGFLQFNPVPAPVLAPGWYWTALVVFGNAGSTAAMVQAGGSIGASASDDSVGLPNASPQTVNAVSHYYLDWDPTWGPLPGDWGNNTSSASGAPLLWLHPSAVP